MASIYNRGTTQAASWWIKFSDPRTGVVHRRSLETADGYRARLLQKKLEHLLALRRPQLSDIEIPPAVLTVID
jgi:hypothetical protein